jgi:membrane protein YqaA with SNARE-associated domain
LKKLLLALKKYTALLVVFLKPLGVWGVLFLGAFDSGLIPIPIDLIVGGYVWNNQGRFWLYCLMAAAGSSLGSLIPYLLGRAGGEVFLLKRIDRKQFEAMRDRFAKQEFFALMIPTLLPPPSPCKLFMFCAGVFEMRVPLYLLAVFTGRVLRFFILALLVIHFGPQVIPLIGTFVARHISIVLLILAVTCLVWALKMRSQRDAKRRLESRPTAEAN